MKKNNKGFFLAETIIVIALVTTVMAFVFPNISKLYDNYKNRTLYYDQTEDLYTLKAALNYIDSNSVSGSNYTILEELTKGTSADCSTDEIGGKTINTLTDISSKWSGKPGNLKGIYIISYMSNPTSTNYNFNKYLKRIKKTSTDNASYRLIGEFEEGGVKRYASIKVQNPNPARHCNLGG